MRCFLAVDVPEDIKNRMSKLQQELTGLDAKPVEKENLHFTLKFLGELDEEKTKSVVKRVGNIKTGQFTVLLKSIGFFPSSSFIRVVWAGAESEQFLNLHIAVNELLADMLPKEKPVPHLTLARVRSQIYNKQLQAFAGRHHDEEFGSFLADKIRLKKSTLTKHGPLHEDLEVFDLT